MAPIPQSLTIQFLLLFYFELIQPSENVCIKWIENVTVMLERIGRNATLKSKSKLLYLDMEFSMSFIYGTSVSTYKWNYISGYLCRQSKISNFYYNLCVCESRLLSLYFILFLLKIVVNSLFSIKKRKVGIFFFLFAPNYHFSHFMKISGVWAKLNNASYIFWIFVKMQRVSGHVACAIIRD